MSIYMELFKKNGYLTDYIHISKDHNSLKKIFCSFTICTLDRQSYDSKCQHIHKYCLNMNLQVYVIKTVAYRLRTARQTERLTEK